MRRFIAAAVLLIIPASLASCSSGPPCVKSHMEMVWVPQYNAVLKTTTMMLLPIGVCDQYAKPVHHKGST